MKKSPPPPNRTYHYKIDTEGHLWIEGTQLTDPATLKFFMQRMEQLPDGSLRVLCMGENNLIEAEDVPYVIQSLRQEGERIWLNFAGGYQEELQPQTLRVGKDNVLYCKVRQGAFAARFNRKSYLEISRKVERDPQGVYHLHLGEKKYPISGVVE